MGACTYCGQMIAAAADDREATELCRCYEAECARKRMASTEAAKACVLRLFGTECEARGLVPLSDAVIRALCSVVDLLGRGDIQAATMQIPGICTAKMSLSGFQIKVERVESRKYSESAGEK